MKINADIGNEYSCKLTWLPYQLYKMKSMMRRCAKHSFLLLTSVQSRKQKTAWFHKSKSRKKMTNKGSIIFHPYFFTNKYFVLCYRRK